MDSRLESLNTLLVETFNAILKVEEQSLRAATQSSVTVTEMHTLDAIGTGDPRTVSELATATKVTVSTMTIAINRLEAKRYVERVRETADRRVVRVRLTDRGRALAYAHQRFHRRMARAVVDGMPEEELNALTRAMENLRGFFRDESDHLHAAMRLQGAAEPRLDDSREGGEGPGI